MSHPESRPIAAARELYPGAPVRPYLNVAVRSLLARPVREVCDWYLDGAMEGGPDKDELFNTVERGRARFARWIGADPDEVAWTRNVTDGMNLFLTALDWRDGDEVVYCPDLEHPANVLPWRNLALRRGVRLKAVPADGGRLPSARMAEAVGPRTRVVAAAAVSYSPGFVADLAPLKEARDLHGACLVVDAAQSVGVLRTDVDRIGADVLAVATQKSLSAFYGTGFLYCRRGVAEALKPAALGRHGVLFNASETALPDADIPYAPGARRFDLGNYNYLGAVAADRALELLESFGAVAIEERSLGLAHRLANGLAELGLPLTGGVPNPWLSHIVTVGKLGRQGERTVKDPGLADLWARLKAADVVMSVRRAVLRFSCFIHNDEADIDRVLEVAREWRRETAPPVLSGVA
ncbi:MAG: aminotransferase class V-fold PLP-dependent enzyme [Acidobacteriota bacterium]|nr:aminotransferase class V-fold PLP-dependent enzyme [Acidobacteriota bacterium]